MPREAENADHGGAGLAPAEVKAYLARNPDFLADNPELIAALTPPTMRHDGPVLDMQRFMIERLQAEVTRLKSLQGELIEANQSNMASQSQIHAAVLALLGARDFEHLTAIVTSAWVDLLELEAVALCLEAARGSAARRTMAGVYMLGPGVISRRVGEGRDVVLKRETEGDRAIFRTRAPRVRSEALIRLHLDPHAPLGLLALGAAEEDRFHPGQGTELLAFLGRALEHCLRAWLAEPG